MTVLYGDPSALIRAYFADEVDHDALREMLLFGNEPVVLSEIGRLEVASAMMAAERAGRVADGSRLIARFEADCAEGGPLHLLALRSGSVDRANQLVLSHPLRALDALHLAVALEDALAIAADEDVAFVTRDRRQADAAIAMGFDVRW
jgi:uncharacterized protein